MPILFMSGYHPGTAPTEEHPTRPVDLIEKPFTIDLLLRRVADAIAAAARDRPP